MRKLTRLASMVLALQLALGCGDDGSGSGGAGASGATSAQNGSGSGSSGSNGSGTAGTTSTGVGGSSGHWQPVVGTTWQWQLTDYPVDTSFQVSAYDIDLFESADATLNELHQAGRIVICYFSAGSWESYRPDAGAFSQSVKGAPLDPPFSDELWLDIRSSEVRDLMKARLDLAVSRGCDAVEPDNVDGFDNANGLGLSAGDQIDFNRFIAAEAHARGLSVGLKNDLAQLDELVGDFDWALNEECYSFDECGDYSGNFLAANKAVFHAEYLSPGQLLNVCNVTKPLGLSTLLKNIDLDAPAAPCP